MNNALAPTFNQDEALVAELHRLGVRHLARFTSTMPKTPMPPGDLLAALARHPQARFQASLILLLLRQPALSTRVPQALERLEKRAALTLKLYYQAAVYLQRELEPEMTVRLDNWQLLPDLFSTELGLPPAESVQPDGKSVQSALEALGAAHRRLTGWAFNWVGAYRQNIPLFLKHLSSDSANEHPHA